MYKSKAILPTLFILVAFVTILGAQGRPTVVAEGDTILVTFADQTITTRDLRNKINTLPETQRPRFRTVSGQKQILDMMITEEIFYKKGWHNNNMQYNNCINNGFNIISRYKNI